MFPCHRKVGLSQYSLLILIIHLKTEWSTAHDQGYRVRIMDMKLVPWFLPLNYCHVEILINGRLIYLTLSPPSMLTLRIVDKFYKKPTTNGVRKGGVKIAIRNE